MPRFPVIAPAHLVPVSARRCLAGLLRAVRGPALRLHYRFQRTLPLRADRALFAADRGRGGGDPGALEQAFRTVAPHIRTAWAADPAHHHTLPPGPRRLTPGTAAYWTALARSRYLVHGTDLDGRLVTRRGQIVVRTGAGAPLGVTGPGPAGVRGTDAGRPPRGSGVRDGVIPLSPRPAPDRGRTRPVPEFGQPRTDALLRATEEDVARLRQTLGLPGGVITVLYAPAYRAHRPARPPGPDLGRLLTRLGPRHAVLLRAEHPDGAPPAPVPPRHPRLLDVTGHPRVESLLLAADVLVTDGSPLVFDYAVLDRPIVVLAGEAAALPAPGAARGPARDARDAWVAVRTRPPGPVVRTEDELTGLLASGRWDGAESARLRAAFRERFCRYDDGHAAERVVRHIVLGETDLPPVVPLCARRPARSAVALSGRTASARVPHSAGSRRTTDSL
ncbi:CDP-glycerol glycerophosphotransferase family protein [Streptomyces tagetis]|uniref:CDP-glycerol glycerophosphotransferase family protein n=1 Tax=Streptomyces tagetis TaxID=2820809 RepID=A0A940XIC7_9ACTN|nr:CDP-glycerol glycerophosphotransferase family protein [Streptomyces sp. RG38]MBQ0828961.1 CDP-glycerol glycerophosphotransferase family protein [Streptomyces sp. RG38]